MLRTRLKIQSEASFVYKYIQWPSDDDIYQTLLETRSNVSQLQTRFVKKLAISYYMYIYIMYQYLCFAGYYSY